MEWVEVVGVVCRMWCVGVRKGWYGLGKMDVGGWVIWMEWSLDVGYDGLSDDGMI